MISLPLIAALMLLIILATGLYNTFKPLPAGVSRNGDEHPLYDVRLLADLSWRDRQNRHQQHHEIFDEIFRLIGQARKLVVLDMFLFNDSAPDPGFAPLSRQLADALIARKAALPELDVLVITDPLNTFYGGTRQPDFERLKAAGIAVTETRLEALRDSNPWYSALWRVALRHLGNNPDGGWLPNALGDQPATLRSYLALPNFKANHRKTLIVDEGEQLRGLITSANPHAGSARHWNTAISFAGPVVAELLETELAVLRFSGTDVPAPVGDAIHHYQNGRERLTSDSGESGKELQGRIVTEAAIRDEALRLLNTAGSGDRVDLAMFYLAHRDITRALIDAHRRGAQLRVLLDRNEDAFGHAKNGIPNRQVAWHLQRAGVDVRWCNTHGEQCHNKFLLVRRGDDSAILLTGSANFTRRNLDDLNLETDLVLHGPAAAGPLQRCATLFDRLWFPPPEAPEGSPEWPGVPKTVALSLDYQDNADESLPRYWRYRLMEASGLSTF